MIKKVLVLAIVLLSSIMPSAVATPLQRPVIVVLNESKAFTFTQYSILYQYLNEVAKYWDIYQGVYWIHLRDSLPKKIVFPKGAIGGHVPNAVTYIDIKSTLDMKLDPYYVITHELAEMAVDPNNNRYSTNGKLIEVCDGLNQYFLLGNHQVSAFLKPTDYL